MARKRFYTADPRRQRLAPPDPDGLMWMSNKTKIRIRPSTMERMCKERMTWNNPPHYKADPSFFWAETTRRIKNERSAEK